MSYTAAMKPPYPPSSGYGDPLDDISTNTPLIKHSDAAIVEVRVLTPKYETNTFGNSVIDIVALGITSALVAGMVALGVYVWRKRCRKGACQTCRDNDMEDNGLVWDPKDVSGKLD